MTPWSRRVVTAAGRGPARTRVVRARAYLRWSALAASRSAPRSPASREGAGPEPAGPEAAASPPRPHPPPPQTARPSPLRCPGGRLFGPDPSRPGERLTNGPSAPPPPPSRRLSRYRGKEGKRRANGLPGSVAHWHRDSVLLYIRAGSRASRASASRRGGNTPSPVPPLPSGLPLPAHLPLPARCAVLHI